MHRSRQSVWLLLATTLAEAACGGSGATHSDAGGAGGAATGSGGVGGSTIAAGRGGGGAASTATSSATGGAGGDPFAQANPIIVGAAPSYGALADPSASADFYSFTGRKGERIEIVTDARPSSNEFDPTYLDLVITLFDASHVQIAQQDDPWPRVSNDPDLYTVLPADGEYFLEVQECNAVAGRMCSMTTAITHTTYTVEIVEFGASPTNPVTDEVAETTSAHADDAPSSPNAIKYVLDTTRRPPQYVTAHLDGTFVDSGDVDVYAFTPKSSHVPSGTRANARFWIATAGSSENGSTTPVGVAQLVDGDDMSVIAELDARSYGDWDTAGNSAAELAAPITLGRPYYLFVARPPGPVGANDFYVIAHLVEGVNPVEAESTAGPNTNDTIATAEPLVGSAVGNGMISYDVEGDLPPGDAADVFSVPSAGYTLAFASCPAARIGSGLRASTLELLGADGGAMSLGSVTEDPAIDSAIQRAPIPPGGAPIYLKITPGTRAPNVTSTHYRCNVTLAP